jgi:AhpD family alkylhydroperoxidase
MNEALRRPVVITHRHIPPPASVYPNRPAKACQCDRTKRLEDQIMQTATTATTAATLQPRMKNPAAVLPGAWQAIQAVHAATGKAGVPAATLDLVHLRASQINGCSSCVNAGWQTARKAGPTDERLFTVAAWREAPYFTDAERAALALTEAVTRLSDRADPVPDQIWDEAARYYDEKGLAALILTIATTNLFNRLNVTTRQVAGGTWA